jgi:integrase
LAWKEEYRTGPGERRYRIVWRTPDGSKKSKSFTRSKDADTFRVEIERKERLGDLWEERPLTFGEFWEPWVERYRPQVRPASFKRRMETKRHLAELWPLTFDKITPALVEDIVMPVATESPRQAQYVLQTIKMVLRSARVRGQRINADTLSLTPPVYESKRKRFLTKDQVDDLAEESDCPRLILFAALTGLRFVELSGLTDEHVGLGERTVVITRDITKTDAGVRTVPLGAEARSLLAAQKLARFPGSTHIFAAPRGGKLAYANFYNRSWRPLTEGRWSGLGFHALRHTFASLCIAANVQAKTLQVLMGHESIKVTLDTYGHLYDGAGTEAMETLDLFLRRTDAGTDTASREAR